MAVLKKDNIYFSILVIGVALITFALASKNISTDVTDKKEDIKNQANSDGTLNSGLATANVLEGVLRPSEDLLRGNLKLVSQYSDIYIRTARDFSSLIGLEVLVKINGTLDKFELVDVQAKIESDGFLISQ